MSERVGLRNGYQRSRPHFHEVSDFFKGLCLSPLHLALQPISPFLSHSHQRANHHGLKALAEFHASPSILGQHVNGCGAAMGCALPPQCLLGWESDLRATCYPQGCGECTHRLPSQVNSAMGTHTREPIAEGYAVFIDRFEFSVDFEPWHHLKIHHTSTLMMFRIAAYMTIAEKPSVF